MSTKQVIVVRKDLNMRKGKLAAQVAHASLGVFTRRITPLVWTEESDCQCCVSEFDCTLQNWRKRSKEVDPDVYPNADPCKKFRSLRRKCHFTQEMDEWLNDSFTKIVVSCDTEQDLLDLADKAKEKDIPHCLVKDNGQTEFKELCPECEGKHFGDSTCPRCKGSGKINKPTYTCIAIGPDTIERVNELTQNFQLL